MPSDFRCRLDAALDVACPPPPLTAIRFNAERKAKRETLLRRAFAAIALTLALGGLSLSVEHARPSPGAPQPIASSTPAPTFT